MEVIVEKAYERNLHTKINVCLTYRHGSHILSISNHAQHGTEILYKLHYKDNKYEYVYGDALLQMFVDPLPLGRMHMKLKRKFMELYEACRTLDNASDRRSTGMWSYDESGEQYIVDADWNNFLASIEDCNMFIADVLKEKKK